MEESQNSSKSRSFNVNEHPNAHSIDFNPLNSFGKMFIPQNIEENQKFEEGKGEEILN